MEIFDTGNVMISIMHIQMLKPPKVHMARYVGMKSKEVTPWAWSTTGPEVIDLMRMWEEGEWGNPVQFYLIHSTPLKPPSVLVPYCKMKRITKMVTLIWLMLDEAAWETSNEELYSSKKRR